MDRAAPQSQPKTPSVWRAPGNQRSRSQSPTAGPKQSQQKLLYALVDSGVGGAMSAALLKEKEPVRQLGSYICLPIGQKPEKQATAYTAGMALWPLVAPLKNKEGQYDDKVAEHVVIACNSASVRIDGAIPVMEGFCKAVNDNGGAFILPGKVKDRIRDLHHQVQTNPSYFKEHVHEIVTKTAQAAADKAFNGLTGENTKGAYFIRVDSTNGTADSKSYLKKIPHELQNKFAEKAYTMVEELDSHQKTKVGKDEYVISHKILKFENADGNVKTVYIEGRGNPPWVPAIEKGHYVDTGGQLVEDSLRASKAAAENMSTSRAEVFTSSPDLSMMCCTHYPPMKTFLASQYGEQTEFINQATIVKDIVQGIKKQTGQPAVVSDGDLSSLDLVVTIGSQNEGGVTVPIDPAKGVRSDIPKSIETPDQTKTMLSGVIDATRTASGDNTPATVTIHTQDEAHGMQDDFECMQRFMGLQIASEIMREQGYFGEYENSASGKITRWISFEVDRKLDTPWSNVLKGPLYGANKIAAQIPAPVQDSINGLAQVITTGENRGVDKFAAHFEVGRHLQAATAQLASTIKSNRDLPSDQRVRVGILTGFTVIDNETGASKGGENDGPPGAAIMAKTLVGQGTPVTLVTDGSAEASLLNTLEAVGLAEVRDSRILPHQRTVSDYTLNESLKVEVARRPPLDAGQKYDMSGDQQIVEGIRTKLGTQNIGTMISIERPSVTNQGKLFSMLAKDISQHNMDMHQLLVKAEGWTPYTIGIGDGGNELGTGQASRLVGEMRAPNLELFVGRGTAIAASAEIKTDAMILASVSNTGGIALSMATLAALGEGQDKLVQTATNYGTIITSLEAKNLSIDGVNKVNANTVDGRAMGSVDGVPRRVEAEPLTQEGRNVPIDQQTYTHADMMKLMLAQFESDET